MATPKSEVYKWLCSISNGLELERLAGEFESRGFRTVNSLKYLKTSDLDVLLNPSPHKLMMAEKRIIESEIEKVKGLESGQLPPRELFPLPSRAPYDQTSTFTSPTASNVVLFNNTSINKTLHLAAKTSEPAGLTREILTEPQISTQPSSYIKKMEEDLKHNNDLLAAQIQSANDVLVMKTREFENFGSGSTERRITRLQSAFVEVPSKVESAWTTFGARFKAGQRRGQKIANCLEVDFPAQRYAKFPRMQWGQILAAWLLG